MEIFIALSQNVYIWITFDTHMNNTALNRIAKLNGVTLYTLEQNEKKRTSKMKLKRVWKCKLSTQLAQ